MKSILLFLFTFILIDFNTLFCQETPYALARVTSTWGAINLKGEFVIDPEFAIINKPHEKYMPYYSEEKEMLFPPSEGIFKFRRHGKFGFKNDKGEVIDNEFEYASSFKEGYSIVSDGFNHGLIDHSGKWQFKSSRFKIQGLSEGRVLIVKGSRLGFLDFNGKVIIPAIYKSAELFENGLACVKDKDGWKLINTSGGTVQNLTFDEVSSLGEKRFKVKDHKLWGVIDEKGKLLLPCQFEEIHDFNCEVATVMIDNKWGLIDLSGNQIIECNYTSLSDCSEGVVVYRKVDYQGFLMNDGTLLGQELYTEAYDFHDGLARVKIDDKYGFIDTTGKLVINPTFENAFDFSNGLCAVRKGNSWGFINPSGLKVIDYRFNDVSSFIK